MTKMKTLPFLEKLPFSKVPFRHQRSPTKEKTRGIRKKKIWARTERKQGSERKWCFQSVSRAKKLSLIFHCIQLLNAHQMSHFKFIPNFSPFSGWVLFMLSKWNKNTKTFITNYPINTWVTSNNCPSARGSQKSRICKKICLMK